MEGANLLEALEEGNLDNVKQILKTATPSDVNVQHSETEDTPLIIASEKGQLDIVQQLLSHGANVMARNVTKATAIHAAASRDQVDVVQVLHKHGGDLNAIDNSGMNPLHLAVQRKFIRSVKLLLKLGADTNLCDNTWHRVPLYDAVKQADFRMAQMLLEKDAKTNVQDTTGTTPLHEAVADNNLHLARLLLKYGADINMKENITGTSPLDQVKSSEMKQLLTIFVHKASRESLRERRYSSGSDSGAHSLSGSRENILGDRHSYHGSHENLLSGYMFSLPSTRSLADSAEYDAAFDSFKAKHSERKAKRSASLEELPRIPKGVSSKPKRAIRRASYFGTSTESLPGSTPWKGKHYSSFSIAGDKPELEMSISGNLPLISKQPIVKLSKKYSNKFGKLNSDMRMKSRSLDDMSSVGTMWKSVPKKQNKSKSLQRFNSSEYIEPTDRLPQNHLEDIIHSRAKSFHEDFKHDPLYLDEKEFYKEPDDETPESNKLLISSVNSSMEKVDFIGPDETDQHYSQEEEEQICTKHKNEIRKSYEDASGENNQEESSRLWDNENIDSNKLIDINDIQTNQGTTESYEQTSFENHNSLVSFFENGPNTSQNILSHNAFETILSRQSDSSKSNMIDTYLESNMQNGTDTYLPLSKDTKSSYDETISSELKPIEINPNETTISVSDNNNFDVFNIFNSSQDKTNIENNNDNITGDFENILLDLNGLETQKSAQFQIESSTQNKEVSDLLVDFTSEDPDQNPSNVNIPTTGGNVFDIINEISNPTESTHESLIPISNVTHSKIEDINEHRESIPEAGFDSESIMPRYGTNKTQTNVQNLDTLINTESNNDNETDNIVQSSSSIVISNTTNNKDQNMVQLVMEDNSVLIDHSETYDSVIRDNDMSSKIPLINPDQQDTVEKIEDDTGLHLAPDLTSKEAASSTSVHLHTQNVNLMSENEDVHNENILLGSSLPQKDVHSMVDTWLDQQLVNTEETFDVNQQFQAVNKDQTNNTLLETEVNSSVDTWLDTMNKQPIYKDQSNKVDQRTQEEKEANIMVVEKEEVIEINSKSIERESNEMNGKPIDIKITPSDIEETSELNHDQQPMDDDENPVDEKSEKYQKQIDQNESYKVDQGSSEIRQSNAELETNKINQYRDDEISDLNQHVNDDETSKIKQQYRDNEISELNQHINDDETSKINQQYRDDEISELNQHVNDDETSKINQQYRDDEISDLNQHVNDDESSKINQQLMSEPGYYQGNNIFQYHQNLSHKEEKIPIDLIKDHDENYTAMEKTDFISKVETAHLDVLQNEVNDLTDTQNIQPDTHNATSSDNGEEHVNEIPSNNNVQNHRNEIEIHLVSDIKPMSNNDNDRYNGTYEIQSEEAMSGDTLAKSEATIVDNPAKDNDNEVEMGNNEKESKHSRLEDKMGPNSNTTCGNQEDETLIVQSDLLIEGKHNKDDTYESDNVIQDDEQKQKLIELEITVNEADDNKTDEYQNNVKINYQNKVGNNNLLKSHEGDQLEDGSWLNEGKHESGDLLGSTRSSEENGNVTPLLNITKNKYFDGSNVHSQELKSDQNKLEITKQKVSDANESEALTQETFQGEESKITEDNALNNSGNSEQIAEDLTHIVNQIKDLNSSINEDFESVESTLSNEDAEEANGYNKDLQTYKMETVQTVDKSNTKDTHILDKQTPTVTVQNNLRSSNESVQLKAQSHPYQDYGSVKMSHKEANTTDLHLDNESHKVSPSDSIIPLLQQQMAEERPTKTGHDFEFVNQAFEKENGDDSDKLSDISEHTELSVDGLAASKSVENVTNETFDMAGPSNSDEKVKSRPKPPSSKKKNDSPSFWKKIFGCCMGDVKIM